MYKIEDIINKIHCADCLQFMRGMPDNCVDLIASDPPYQLSTIDRFAKKDSGEKWCVKSGVFHRTSKGFMGKEWDVLPTVDALKECLRVLKPGAFSFWLMTPRQDSYLEFLLRLRDAGFVLGFTGMWWCYACLSADTEILTQRGWKSWKQIKNKQEEAILTYDKDKKTYGWEVPMQWNSYQVKDTCYRIKSDYTDQLVSRNHRCLVEQEGILVFKTPEEIRKLGAGFVVVPYMESLPELSNYLFDAHMLIKKGKQLWFILRNFLSPTGQYQKVSFSKRQTLAFHVGKPETKTKGTDDGFKKSCVERRGNLFQKARKLFTDKICQVSERVFGHGAERWLCYGTSVVGGSTDWQAALKKRGGSSFRPQPAKQSFKKPCFVSKQPNTQDVRGGKEYRTTVANIKPECYKGIVYCPTVSKGCFVARRNGKMFLTGNSGFPKSQNIALAVDKQECRKMLAQKLGRKPTKEEFDKEWEDFRSVVGYGASQPAKSGYHAGLTADNVKFAENKERFYPKVTAPRSEQAKALNGSFGGFQPKPALEAIIVAMKPLSEKTYVDQVLANGHGITWLDDCQIPYTDKNDKEGARFGSQTDITGGKFVGGKGSIGKNVLSSETGRFPANLLVSDDALCVESKGAQAPVKGTEASSPSANTYGDYSGHRKASEIKDASGSFSRYFDLDRWFEDRLSLLPPNAQKTFPCLIVPKASRREKNRGCESLPEKKVRGDYNDSSQLGLLEKIQNSPRPTCKNFHPCLTPESLIVTTDGVKEIKDITTEDRVLTEQGIFERVIDKTNHPIEEYVYNIKVEGMGESVKATDNHPFLTYLPIKKGKSIVDFKVGWIEAKNLKAGFYLMTPIIKTAKSADGLNEELCYILGFWLAEGSFLSAGHGKHFYLVFSVHKRESERITNVLKKITNKKISVYGCGENGRNIVVFDWKLAEKIKSMAIGQAKTKALKPFWVNLSRQSMESIFKGYIDGDGCKIRTYLQAKTISLNLAFQMKFIAEKIGYIAEIQKEDDRARVTYVEGRQIKNKNMVYHMRFYDRNISLKQRKPSRPTLIDVEDGSYHLSLIKSVNKTEYSGEVVNLTIENSPTFQTAVGMSHNTCKPLKLMMYLVTLGSRPNDIVYDPYAGTATTLIAAKALNRRYIGVEKDPEYLKLAEARLQAPWTAEEIEKCAGGDVKENSAVAEGEQPDLFEGAQQ